jgi:hypothetical protein
MIEVLIHVPQAERRRGHRAYQGAEHDAVGDACLAPDDQPDRQPDDTAAGDSDLHVPLRQRAGRLVAADLLDCQRHRDRYSQAVHQARRQAESHASEAAPDEASDENPGEPAEEVRGSTGAEGHAESLGHSAEERRLMADVVLARDAGRNAAYDGADQASGHTRPGAPLAVPLLVGLLAQVAGIPATTHFEGAEPDRDGDQHPGAKADPDAHAHVGSHAGGDPGRDAAHGPEDRGDQPARREPPKVPPLQVGVGLLRVSREVISQDHEPAFGWQLAWLLVLVLVRCPSVPGFPFLRVHRRDELIEQVMVHALHVGAIAQFVGVAGLAAIIGWAGVVDLPRQAGVERCIERLGQYRARAPELLVNLGPAEVLAAFSQVG